MNPYIGITDFMNFGQVQDMLKVFAAHLPKGSSRRLHVGVMMSRKTLRGIPTRWQNVFPPNEKIAEIFSATNAYNCLHYADSDHDPELGKNLTQAVVFYGGVLIHALQLDLTWPDPVQVACGVNDTCKNIEVILQIGRRAFDQVGNDPQILVQKLAGYEGIINRVLLDKSMGQGLGMDAISLIPFAQAIREAFPTLGIGAAGGLGPETIRLVEPLARSFPDLSIDAQGRLRPSGNALDPIDWNMAGNYLIKAIQLLA